MYRKFKILFSISILHDYYNDDFSEDFEVIPTEVCRQALRNYDLIFKKFGKQVLVLFGRAAKTKEETGEVIKKIDETLKLSFVLKLKNQNFQGISELGNIPDSQIGQSILYFSNLNHTTGEADLNVDPDGRIVLTKNNMVSDADFNSRVNHSFRIPVDGSKYKNIELFTTTIRHPLQGIGLQKIEQQQTSLLLNLRDYLAQPEGKYTLKVLPRSAGQQEIPHEVVVEDANLRNFAFGYIEIFLDENIDYATPKDYIVKFQSINKPWKYFIISPETKPQINENGNEERLHFEIEYKPERNLNKAYYPEKIDFQLIEEAGLEEAQLHTIASFSPKQVVLFESVQTLPILDRKLLGLRLYKKDDLGDRKLIIEHLPNPNLNSLTQEIYINLQKL